MKPVNFAIVGFGNIGTRHAGHIHKNKEAQLIAICDIDSKRLEHENSANAKQFSDYLDMLDYCAEKVDVVNVCSPNYLHVSMCIEALNRGLNVVCEKPMAMSALECQAIIDAAEQNKKHLFVVKQNRYNPPVAAVKKLIEEDRLGKVYQVVVNCLWNRNAAYYLNSGWRGSKKKDGGCLFTQCSHFIDILYYLLGPCDSISGIISNSGHEGLIEFEDNGSFILKSQKDEAIISFNFSTCSYQKNLEGAITILAEKGTVKIGGQYLNTIEYQCIEDYVIPDLPQGNGPNNYGSYTGSMSNHDKVIENVVDTILGRDTIATNGQNGKDVVSIIEDMYNSVSVPESI